MSDDANLPTEASTLPPSVADRVLTRASEIDALRTSDLSVAQIRQVATEAGISPAAVERALHELEVGDLPPATPAIESWPGRFGRSLPVFHPVLIAIASATLGWMSRAFRPIALSNGFHVEALLSFEFLAGASVYLLWQHAARRQQKALQRDLLILWGGFALWWSLLNGGPWMRVSLVVLGWWAAFAVLGAGITAWSRRRIT